LQLTWLGAAGFKIETQVGAVIVINPFISQPTSATPAHSLQLTDLSPVDEILLTESRFVYAMDTPALVKTTGAIAHAPPAVCRHLLEVGVSPNNIEPVKPHKNKTVARLNWQAWSVKEISNNFKLPEPVGASPLYELTTAWLATETVNYTFQTEGLTMVYAGSADWIDPELEGLQPDIALLPVDTAVIDKIVQWVAMLHPTVIIPHCWDNYFPPLTQAVNIEELKNRLQAEISAGSIFWPTPGQTFNISELL
jgi:L-ascorbate metabolism protein UlaG (beta-lactamase superfamily)